MKVIWFNGNFGNQIFYCAYKDYLKAKYPYEKVYSFIDAKCPPVKIEERTNLILPLNRVWISILSFFVFKIVGFVFRRIPSRFIPSWYCGRGVLRDESTFFGNSLQEKSFYEGKKSNWLEIKEPSCPTLDYQEWKKAISDGSSVCVHIRRGDYIGSSSAYVDLSLTDYYQRSIEYAKKILPDARFFFFSDDLDFAKRLFSGDNISFVDCSKGNNSYLDMNLMSLAKINIIANSTFSYWAAYINHENKTVIYPKAWFNEWTGRNAPNIMLDSWIGI